jgi:glycosyltransferase involved in cell wall biosynthesis
MTPLRVLHVVNSLEPGGMENGVVNLATGLESEGIRSDVACLSRRGEFAERLPSASQTIVLGKTNGFSPRASLRLMFEVARRRPHVIHSHNLGPLIYVSLATLGGRLAPILHGEHSALTSADYSPKRVQQRRRLYRGCAAIHTVADATRDELIALGTSPEDLHSIPNGVDTDRFAPGDRVSARAAFGLPADAFVIGIAGRFGPFKGHRAMIEAFTLLALRIPALHLLIVGGGGSLEGQARACADRQVHRERIHFTGLLKEPAPAYVAMDLLVVPSTNEGMSNVALEAMASGTPVLANRDCGHEQIIEDGETGWLRDLREPFALARAIEELHEEGAAFVDFGKKASTRVAAEFSLERMLARYTQLYRALAARR